MCFCSAASPFSAHASAKGRKDLARFCPAALMSSRQVRRNQKQIDMPVILEAMEKIRLGLRHQPLPPSEAKRHMASLLAARAVCVSCIGPTTKSLSSLFALQSPICCSSHLRLGEHAMVGMYFNRLNDCVECCTLGQVALTLTPGIPPIEHITILPRGGVQSRVLFTPLVSAPMPSKPRH